MAAATTYEQIGWTSLSSTATSITFSSIPASWTDLRLIINYTSGDTGGAQINFRLNGDAASLYSRRYLYGNAVGTGSGANQNNNAFYLDPVADVLPAFATADFLSYAGSTYKTGLFTSVADLVSSGTIFNAIGVYRSTAAITSVTVFLAAGSTNLFSIGTTAALYGIKAA